MAKSKKTKEVVKPSLSDDEEEKSIGSENGAEPDKSAIIPTYVIEIAKSGRAECRKCENKIGKNELRIGVITEGDWGLYTKWQHLACTVFHRSVVEASAIDGYKELSEEMKASVDKRVQESQNEIDDENVPINPDELVRVEWSEAKEPSDQLLMPLLPYQKEGLGWMAYQESTSMRGGILADEMGMGKTIQAIALILENRRDTSDLGLDKLCYDSDLAHGVDPNQLKRGGTLLVLPTVAIRQWQMEIARFTRFGALRVHVYHGSDRKTTVDDLTAADIIITSYKILEIEYRKATAGYKVVCRICQKKFYPEKLRIHRKYFCGESAQRTTAQSKTVKKKARIGAQTEVVEQDDENSSEDEIDKQKKLIKSLKENKGSNSKAKVIVVNDDDEISEKKVSGRSISKSSTGTKKIGQKNSLSKSLVESSSDDEIAKQKKLIKAIATKKGQKSVKALPVTDSVQIKKKKTKPNLSTKLLEERKSVESSEDEIDKQKKMIKAMKEKKESSTKKKLLSKPKSKTKRSIPKKKNTSDSDDEDDSDFEVEDESSESDSDSDGTVDDLDGVISVKPNKSTSNSKFNTSIAIEGDDDNDDVMREVEEDIQKALLAEVKKRKNKETARSWLHEISWFRIILDEAHLIKDRSTSTARAIFNLISLYKWCLTGTPLQNRVGELYSLVRFLRIDPHAYYYCKVKDCTCRSLHYRFTQGKCDDCHHSSMFHFSHFNKHILNPIKRSGYINEGRKAMLKLKEQLLDEILLRRTKATRAEDIQLPPRIVRVQYNHLDEKEDDFYQALYTQSQAQFNTYVASGTILNNYAHIFDILIKLRQAVDHPYLVIYSDNNKNPPVSVINPTTTSSKKKRGLDEELDEIIENVCGICNDMIEQGQVCRAACGHYYCRDCILDHINTTTNAEKSVSMTSPSNFMSPRAACPVCNEPLTIDLDSPTNDNSVDEYTGSISASANNRNRGGLVMLSGKKKSIVDKIDLSKFQSSSKMEALMQELHKMQQTEIGGKAIVFSQFVNMLDLLEYRITLGGIQCVKLLGSMSIDQRDKAIKLFKEDANVKVLLISLKAGGVALNLTIANHIYIMDPWWNPAAEMQAIDRTHRIGQRKPIFATRFIIENTIEERILKLQEKKRLVFDGTIGGDSSSMAKLTVDDMRFLFQ